MTFLVFLAAVATLATVGVWQVVRTRVDKVGALIIIWRFLSGFPWHGKPVSDAGWIRPGKRALTRTGHTSRFHMRPRWQRACYRTGWTLATVWALWGLLTARSLTVRCLWAAAGVGVVYGALRAYFAVRRHRHHRTWLRPLHTALSGVVGVPLTAPPSSWLKVERDRSKAVVQLPSGFHADDKTRENIVRVVAQRVGMESPEASWRLAGPDPLLTLTTSSPPPQRVNLADLRPHLEAAGPDTLVLGIGKRGKVVTVSLKGDSPHIGVSAGSGGGKSVVTRLIAAQILHAGGLAIVLDVKRISHSWTRDLPNVHYAKTAEQIHQTLLLLQREVAYRNDVADQAADIEGEVRANVGPRILLICEELNAMRQQLRAYWRDIRENGDPARSPSEVALDEVLFTGRQVKCNAVLIGQRLSAAATGGGDSRENLAAKILARYTSSTWKMLCDGIAPPPTSRHIGRAQVVTDHAAECQVGFLTGAEAREYALAGVVGQLPQRFGGRAVTAAAQIANTGPDQQVVTVTPPPVSQPPSGDLVTLTEAVHSGLLTRSIAAVRMARHRDDRFPQPVAKRGLAHLYDAEQLAAWSAGTPALSP